MYIKIIQHYYIIGKMIDKRKPFKWEDRELLRGKWVRNKNNGSEILIFNLRINKNGFLINNTISAEQLLEYYEFLDGSVIGKIK